MNAPAELPLAAPASELARLFAAQRAAFARERYPRLSGPARPAAAPDAHRHRRRGRAVRGGRRAISAIARRRRRASPSSTSSSSGVAPRTAPSAALDAAAARRDADPAAARGRSRILRQPKGVAGIISPWNYPVQLALAPAIGALAAGNRVLLKPSELTPATSALLQERVARLFREDEFAVVTGDAEHRRGIRAAAVRSPVLHRLHRSGPPHRARRSGEPDAGDARARRQVAGARRRRRRPRARGAAARRRASC